MDDRNQMNRRPMWIPWAVMSLMLVVVAVVAYAIGARHDAFATIGGGQVAHAWFFPFPGIFFGLFFLFFIFGGLRWMWWGCNPYERPWRYRRFYGPYDEREWEEWHRREHQRMDEARTRGGSTP